MSAILRQSYLDKIERYLGKDTIIILTGQRRIGKSIPYSFNESGCKDTNCLMNFQIIDRFYLTN